MGRPPWAAAGPLAGFGGSQKKTEHLPMVRSRFNQSRLAAPILHHTRRNKVNRYLRTLAAACAVAVTIQAQTGNPLIGEAKQAYNGIKNNLQKMAEKMPEEHYSFKPTPDIRTFGQLVAHVADAQMRTCAAVKGEQKQANAASKTSKADLVAALKESSEECDAAFASVTDANANEMVRAGRGQRSRLGALIGTTIHDNEEYGYMAVYLRLKGIVPPSSEGR